MLVPKLDTAKIAQTKQILLDVLDKENENDLEPAKKSSRFLTDMTVRQVSLV